MKNKGLEKEFTRLVTESQGIIHKICRIYCADEEHRKDLFQEILIQLWQSYPSFRGDSKFSTWMYRTGLNVAIQHFRKAKRKQRIFIQTSQFKEIESLPDSAYEDEKLKIMHQAIAHLNKIEKAIIMLYLDNKSNKEIAEIIGITQNYVRVKMSRIKIKLSKNINQ